VAERIHPHRCAPDDLGITEPVGFILAFWMMHEVPDRLRLLRQLRALILDDGHLLIVEPPLHDSGKEMAETVGTALEAGWTLAGRPRMRGSHSALFRPRSPNQG
jgi:hypothetical protein